MIKYKKIYCKHYGYGEQDTILCEHCHKRGHSIHHLISKSQGGKDNIENLIWLCQPCHTKAHNNKQFNRLLKNLKRVEFEK